MVLLGAVWGAGLGLGLLLLVLGIRGTAPARAASSARRVGVPREWALPTVAGGLAGLAMFGLTGWPVGGLLAAVVAVVVPTTLRRSRAQTAVMEQTEAVAVWTEMLRDTLAGAAGLEDAIAASARVAPEPVRAEVTRLARRLEHARLVDALERFADELANPAADLVVAALVTAARREARELVPLLSALARSTRAEAEMRRRVHVGRARVRTTVRVIIATLGLFGGGLILFNRDYLAPYSTATGQLVLLGVGLIFAGGWWLLQRMAAIPEPDRFLGRSTTEPGGR